MKDKLKLIFTKENSLKALKVVSVSFMFLLKFLDDALLILGFLIIYKTTDHLNHIAGNYLLGAALLFAGVMMIRRR
jgi:hypothetical protein